MPDKLKNTYNIEKDDNGIFIYEKISQNQGLGGFAFGLKLFKNPKDYSDMTGNKKLGELTDSKGIIYDMVLLRPTEIQCEKELQKKYNALYNSINNIEIKGINGNKYVKNQGMKGEDLYKEILKNYKQNKAGYIYYDINKDGIDELIIGSKDRIYDIYTMENRYPVRVLSSDETDYFICKDMFLCKDSSSQNEKITQVYILNRNSSELYPQITFITDFKKYYIKYGNSQKKEEISEKLFKKRKNTFKKHKRFNFIQFGEF